MRSASVEAAEAPDKTRQEVVPPLRNGDYLSLGEFLRRWDAMPQLKFAELIRGVVYMPSPLSREHGSLDFKVAGWLGRYSAATPGVEGACNATWLMGEDSPQPDTSLFIMPGLGGRTTMQGKLLQGAPEFLAEICLTSAAYDLHQKLEVYEEARVLEYAAVLVYEREVRWHRLTGDHFEIVPAPTDGIYRSAVFPGLWLDAAALLAGDLARVLAVVHEGIGSPEHAAFVQQAGATPAVALNCPREIRHVRNAGHCNLDRGTSPYAGSAATRATGGPEAGAQRKGLSRTLPRRGCAQLFIDGTGMSGAFPSRAVAMGAPAWRRRISCSIRPALLER